MIANVIIVWVSLMALPETVFYVQPSDFEFSLFKVGHAIRCINDDI